MQHKVKQFLGEKSGQSLRAEIYSDVNGYNIMYFINDNLQTSKTFSSENLEIVEDEAKNWIASLRVLNG